MLYVGNFRIATIAKDADWT